jgi:hypothetical protein
MDKAIIKEDLRISQRLEELFHLLDFHIREDEKEKSFETLKVIRELNKLIINR